MRWALAFLLLSGQAFAQSAQNFPTSYPSVVQFNGLPDSWTAAGNAYLQGFLAIAPPAATGDAQIFLSKSGSGHFSLITGDTASVARWQMELGDNVAEGGSNAGSNFNLRAYNDAGAFLGTWMNIIRSSGLMTYTGSIAHNPVTAFANGVIPGIYQIYSPTGSVGAATSASVNALSFTTDNLAINDPGSLVFWNVNDASFGGAAAQGGRIVGYFGFSQSAASESTHTFRSYVGAQAAINTTSGDGGGSGTEKGDYFGFWSTNIIGASATHVKSMQGMEIDLTALAAPLFKAGLLIGGAALGSADASQGTTVDALIWLTDCTTCVGAKVGIQFGRSDSANGNLGVSSTGTLLATAVETGTIGSGIDLTGGGDTTITNFAFKSPGFSVDGGGNIKGNTANVVSGGSYSWGASLASIAYATDLFFDNASATGHYKFRSSAVEKVRLTKDGHIASLGTAPATPTSCGTSPSITASSSDFAGTVTEGTTATGCTVTFATAFTNAPDCVVSWRSQYPAAFTYTTSTTALTITNTSTSSLKFSYFCQQI